MIDKIIHIYRIYIYKKRKQNHLVDLISGISLDSILLHVFQIKEI